MSAPNDGGPATPIPAHINIDENTVRELVYRSTGLSIRDYFAGQAMMGCLANPSTNADFSAIAMVSFRMADAMLEARKVKT